MRNFYEKFGIVTRLPFWQNYLHKSHLKGFKDVKNLGNHPNFKSSDFTALQSGTAGEITTNEFLKSVYEEASNPKVTVIDLGEKQIASVKKLVKEKYGDKAVEILF